nr:MAG TPA: Protein of unknown function (DUF2786) [Bacteriophage sp.]
MKEEKIIEKIRKCLALAANNPSEEEAKAAALQAQKLLAKYNISMVDIEAMEKTEEKIVESAVWFDECVKGVARAWKYELARIVANNFRCKHFFYGKKAAVFYGHEMDAKTAAEVYKYLFAMGDKLANRVTYRALRAYHKRGESAKVSGIYNSWVRGFLKGLEESLSQQCTALALVVPEDVTSAYTEKSASFKSMKAGIQNTGFDPEAYKDGFANGKTAMASRAIEA